MSGEYSRHQQERIVKRAHDQIEEHTGDLPTFSLPIRPKKVRKDHAFGLDWAHDGGQGAQTLLGNNIQVYEDNTSYDVPGHTIVDIFYDSNKENELPVGYFHIFEVDETFNWDQQRSNAATEASASAPSSVFEEDSLSTCVWCYQEDEDAEHDLDCPFHPLANSVDDTSCIWCHQEPDHAPTCIVGEVIQAAEALDAVVNQEPDNTDLEPSANAVYNCIFCGQDLSSGCEPNCVQNFCFECETQNGHKDDCPSNELTAGEGLLGVVTRVETKG